VDTVYLGTFRKELFEEIGLYDTECRASEDAELNLRILKAGKKIYMDGELQVVYFPRKTLGSLARQYFRYGRGRAYTTRKHRRMTSWRQAAPVLLLVGIGSAIVLGFWQPWFWAVPVVYVGALVLVSLFSWRGKRGEELGKIPFRQRIKLVGAWVAMHVAWGLGFVWETIMRLIPKRDRD
jgi:succinoglycan biosynthesis protein ExoA